MMMKYDINAAGSIAERGVDEHEEPKVPAHQPPTSTSMSTSKPVHSESSSHDIIEATIFRVPLMSIAHMRSQLTLLCGLRQRLDNASQQLLANQIRQHL